MGILLDGRWTTDADVIEGGAYRRKASSFRNAVEARAGAVYPAEPGRYHLYVSLACPWACRTLMVRNLKRLENVISVSFVHPDMLADGWTFGDDPEPVNGFSFLREVYTAADPVYSGRVTVPVLWDCMTASIVSNESAEIIRMLNSEFDAWGDAGLDLYPVDLSSEIDAINAVIYDTVNNGVYKAGFARSQTAYQEAVWALFQTLEMLDERLASQRYVAGSRLTEADVRLFTTAIRFDLVYFSHFKCNVRRWADFHNLDNWLRDVFQTPGITETVDVDQIKRHYYFSQRSVNPTGIVPAGPSIDLRAPHDRSRFR